jgi:hypothetical protein
LRKVFITSLCVTALAAAVIFCIHGARIARAQTDIPGSIRVGERLTYNISYNRFPNVAYAETNVLSKGKIAGKEAFEVRSRLKSLNVVSVGGLYVDVDRTTYISPADGNTLVVKEIDNSAGAPVLESTNFLEKSPGSFDLTALLFKIRASGGVGSYSMFENGKLYNVAFQSIGTETVKSDAGEFPANIIDVKSDFLTEKGFTGLKVSIASEGSSIPVKFRLSKGKKDEYVGLIASVQVTAEPTPTATPVAVQTPRPTPRPSATPQDYVDNQPLIGLPFDLGETLEYSVTAAQRPIGTFAISAKDRKLVDKHDSLLLVGTVTNAAGNELFGIGNSIRTYVDPDTLAPYDFSTAFSGRLSTYNQTARFDQSAGRVFLANNQTVDVPAGTHNILSLFYALRLFNLNPSKDTNNRVNDTRVSVFWQGRANIFTLRPSAPKVMEFGDQKILAQEISVSTGNPQLDSLRIKVWLSSDDRRLPLRFILDGYQFDLKLTNPTLEP